MFGNKELKEVQNQLEIAISIAANQIFCLDPATRSLILKSYRSSIRNRAIYATSYTPFTEDENKTTDILEKILTEVEKLLKEENYEGENYNANFNPNVTKEEDYLIWGEITKKVREFYPLKELEDLDEEEFEEKKNGEFGTPNYPTDIKAYYQAIFYLLMYRQVELNKKGTPMSNATRLSIQLICDYVTPDDTSANEKFSPDLLLAFKREIQGITGFINWMDSKIPQNLDRLKIGDSENDFYRTQQDFINDIDPNEIIDIVRNAWIESKDLEKMPKIKLFEKEIKEKWDDCE